MTGDGIPQAADGGGRRGQRPGRPVAAVGRAPVRLRFRNRSGGGADDRPRAHSSHPDGRRRRWAPGGGRGARRGPARAGLLRDDRGRPGLARAPRAARVPRRLPRPAAVRALELRRDVPGLHKGPAAARHRELHAESDRATAHLPPDRPRDPGRHRLDASRPHERPRAHASPSPTRGAGRRADHRHGRLPHLVAPGDRRPPGHAPRRGLPGRAPRWRRQRGDRPAHRRAAVPAPPRRRRGARLARPSSDREPRRRVGRRLGRRGPGRRRVRGPRRGRRPRRRRHR